MSRRGVLDLEKLAGKSAKVVDGFGFFGGADEGALSVPMSGNATNSLGTGKRGTEAFQGARKRIVFHGVHGRTMGQKKNRESSGSHETSLTGSGKNCLGTVIEE